MVENMRRHTEMKAEVSLSVGLFAPTVANFLFSIERDRIVRVF